MILDFVLHKIRLMKLNKKCMVLVNKIIIIIYEWNYKLN